MSEAQERAQAAEELAMAAAAEAALQNPAIMRYFEAAEEQAIDALLAHDVIHDPEVTLRLITVASTVRAMKTALHKAIDLRSVAQKTIETWDQIKEARGAR